MTQPFAMIAAAWRGGVFSRAIAVAMVVGTLLNLINQGDRLIAGVDVNWFKLALTYAVPFFVSAHGALSAQRS